MQMQKQAALEINSSYNTTSHMFGRKEFQRDVHNLKKPDVITWIVKLKKNSIKTLTA